VKAPTRRRFLTQLALVAPGFGIVHAAFAKPAQHRFTSKVREQTAKLHVKSGRWLWLVAHLSGIAEGNAAIYDRQHRQRGMENGLAYHFVIGNGIDSGDGQIEIGRRWLRQIKGGHVHNEEVNEAGIGICLVGNLDRSRPTQDQLLAFRELVDYLRADVVGKKIQFAVHKEIDPAHTACPGRLFPTAKMHRLYGRLKTVPH
jgi:hypothetical protein